MSINSDVNKGMLYEICSGINNESTNDKRFVTFLDNICDRYHSNRFNYSNIQEMNKNILEELVYYMNKRDEEKTSETRSNIPERNQDRYRELKTIEASELKVQKDEGFSMKLKSREEAFKSLIEKPAPASVEFADKNQDVPSQNLDVLMNQSLADRERELQLIMRTKPDSKAEEWLKSIETSENKKDEKKVRFEESPPSILSNGNQMVSLLSKLKTKKGVPEQTDDDTKEIKEMLKNILNNQSIILNILRKDSKDISGNSDI